MALPLAMLTSGDRAPPWTVAANTRPKKSGAQVTKEMIYGCSLDYPGPPMDGVIAYPYTTSQKLYRDDFETMIDLLCAYARIVGGEHLWYLC